MQYENVDRDPDLRKSSDLGEFRTSWMPRLITLGAVLALVPGVVIVLIYYSQAWGPNQWGNVGTWLAGIATSLAVIVAVWQTNNANKQARAAETRAEAEAALTAQRHIEAMAVAEAQHERELAEAKERLDRQIKAEWYREQARAVAALWETVGRASEPIARLADAIDRHRTAFHKLDHTDEQFTASEKAVTDAYVEWKFRIFEVRTAMTVVSMLVDNPTIIDYLTSLEIRVAEHHSCGMTFKNATMDNGGGSGVSMFMQDINGFMDLQMPMVREIRRLVSSTT